MSSPAELAAQLRAAAATLDGEQMRQTMVKIGSACMKDAREALNADLGGDNTFSGWKRAPMVASFTHNGNGKIHMTGQPAGVWTVAELGRRTPAYLPKRGASKVFRIPGVGRTTHGGAPSGFVTGTRSKPIRNGTTAGKGTWTDALKLMEQRLPERGLEIIANMQKEMTRG